MVAEDTLNNSLDDAMRPIVLLDYLGGLNSETDPADLPVGDPRVPNQTPDCQNVYFVPGIVRGRAGYQEKVTGLPAAPDGLAFYYDSTGARRLVVWSGGNLYDITTFAATLVEAGCYEAGQRIACAVLNSVLYFSDGKTIFSNGTNSSGIRSCDLPVSFSAPVFYSTGDPALGYIPLPAAKVMCVKDGCLVLGCIKYVNGTFARQSAVWTNVNSPGQLNGANVFPVGEGQGGEINCLIPMGISHTGVTPFDAIFVGKSEFGVFLLKGALTPNDLEAIQINLPVGVLDGATAKYISGPDGSAFVAFLGTDRRVWATNSIQTDELSKDIAGELKNYVNDRFATVFTPMFTAGINYENRHYVLDLGANRQYVYDYAQKCWSRYQGWVSGYYVEARDIFSAPVMYVADTAGTRVVLQNAGVTDNGAAIAPYVVTPVLNAGDDDLRKIFHWLYFKYKTDFGVITATATVNDAQGEVSTATFAGGTDTGVKWDDAGKKWDDAGLVWGGSDGGTKIYKKRARFKVLRAGGDYKLLYGYNLQIKFAQTTPGYFEIHNTEILYTPRGRRRVA